MKYLLLILPFMWGCAEKKEYPVYVVAGHDTMIFYQGNTDLTKCRASSGGWVNMDTDSAYSVYTFDRHESLACGDLEMPTLRQGISIDGRPYEESTIGEWELQSLLDTIPGGHSIHAEPYDNTRRTNARERLQAAFDRSYVKHVSPTFSTDSLIRDSGLYKSLADTLKKYSKP